MQLHLDEFSEINVSEGKEVLCCLVLLFRFGVGGSCSNLTKIFLQPHWGLLSVQGAKGDLGNTFHLIDSVNSRSFFCRLLIASVQAPCMLCCYLPSVKSAQF